jgi:hypothetical protein
MNWLNKVFSGDHTESPPEQRHGLPVWQGELSGRSLQDRTIRLLGEPPVELRIREVRIQYLAGHLAAEHPAIVTNFYCQQNYFCGESTVGELVAMWEAAPIDEFDRQDCTRMTREFGLPEYQITTKAQYSDLRDLYDRCDHYYRLVFRREKQVKRITKSQAKELVFTLDQEAPSWEQQDGDNRFISELTRRNPKLIRTEEDKKARRQREKREQAKREEQRPLYNTRNYLTDFPHKKMSIDVQGLGRLEVGALKPLLREGQVTPETLVRYRETDDWNELEDFLADWVRNKATTAQLDYLAALQKQHGITTGIALDMSRREASERISPLAPFGQDYE